MVRPANLETATGGVSGGSKSSHLPRCLARGLCDCDTAETPFELA
jgi:hypothetical protein